ncbi:MAG TPA: S-methyl-5-thioribose-1-phosphate isomerase [Burkholderiaceae bacterium]|nr:S-methyl-5-thioribose-1-phosphate isomerase [Burkholderiaceae bacterium]
MKVGDRHYRSIWPVASASGKRAVGIVDQTRLPFEFVTVELDSSSQVAAAIRSMQVRGAPLIGVAAAYGLALAMSENDDDAALARAHAHLCATRPTAVNLRWALDRMRALLLHTPRGQRSERGWTEAGRIAEEDVACNRALGAHGAELIAGAHTKLQRTVQILTHCNAGWIATVDFGTALSAIYQAFDAGVDLHVWVDETRPRNQGLLTAWELAAHGVPHTLIVGNAGGHLMRRRKVDMVLVGADRVTRRGDVCNKIGTYLKAVAANDNSVPFYAAVPSTTIDWSVVDADTEIEIEARSEDEVRRVYGRDANARSASVEITQATTPVVNPAFDITPARLVTGIITERGTVAPAELARVFSETQGAAERAGV